MASVAELKRQGRAFAQTYGLDPDIFERQIQEESQWNPNAHNARSGADGIAQIIPSYHPGVNTHDPIASLRYAAQWMGQMVHQYSGSYVKALLGYNWGQGRVAQWDGSRASLPGESRKYLDDILGSDWSGTGGGGGGGWAGEIGSAISSGLTSGINNFFTGLVTGAVSETAPMIFTILGFVLLFVGLMGVANQSGATKVVMDTAKTAATVATIA